MMEVRNLSVAFARKILFENFSCRLGTGERFGILGANGSGKSTLLKILAGTIQSDKGEVSKPKDACVFRVGQDFFLDEQKKILDIAMMGDEEVFLALQKKEHMLYDQKNQVDVQELTKIEEVLETKDGYTLKARAQKILCGLGIPSENHLEKISSLSGGYRWRVYLAQVLVKSPDVLLLDEPTNHLDIESISWLEGFLSSYKKTVVLVSHDKKFLDSLVNYYLDIDFEMVRKYKGPFRRFEEEKQLYVENKEKQALGQQKEIEKKQEFIDRFGAKASKARQAQSRLKQIEKINIEKSPVTSRVKPKFNFKCEKNGAKKLLEVENLSKSYGDNPVLKNITFTVMAKEKIAIIGANGAGKSTLIKALSGEFKECLANYSWGKDVILGYFPQNCGEVIKSSKKSILDWLWHNHPEKSRSELQSCLGRMLFSGDDAQKSTENLSGGELARVYFAHLMLIKPHVLLLDEPTNHLDMEAIEALSEALKHYDGTVILVSHDRCFVQNTCVRIIEVSCLNGLLDYRGNYEEFCAYKLKHFDAHTKEFDNHTKPSANNQQESYEERKKRKSSLKKLEKELKETLHKIEVLEQKVSKIETLFAKETFYQENTPQKVAELQGEKAEYESKLSHELKCWEYIEDKINNFE